MSQPPFLFASVTLEGSHVRLEPVNILHLEGLHRAASGVPEIFRYMPMGDFGDFDILRTYVASVADEPASGAGMVFAILDPKTGETLGSTSYLDVSAANRRLEIGRTWLNPAYHRTAVNTECKLLLLGHAFETLGANRVQIKTDLRNLQSQAAIERLGAKKEGVWRAHTILPDGYVRDTVMYSVIASEWPDVKAGLISKLAR